MKIQVYSESKLLVIVLLFSLGCFSSCNNSNVEISRFSQMSNEVMRPFVWGLVNDHKLQIKEIIEDTNKLHPLALGRKTLFLLWDGSKKNDTSKIKLAKEYLDYLAFEYPYKKGSSESELFCYPFGHGHYKGKEWWSGMANSAISLAFLYGHELFEEKIYLEKAKLAMNGTVNDIASGGSSISIGQGSKWFLEYASENESMENGKFVLNGFLFSLLAVKIYAEVTADPYYEMVYQEGLEGLKAYEERFYYEGDQWTYYMLNPLTIESAHYNIFDINLFEGLYKASGDTYFKKELERRRSIIMNRYTPQIKMVDEKKVMIFSSIGTPHPYWIDIYPTLIEYSFANSEKKEYHTLTSPRDFSIPVSERAFFVDTLDPQADSVFVYAEYNLDTLLMFANSLEEFKSYSDEGVVHLSYELEATRDSKTLDSRKIQMVLPENNDSIELIRGTAVMGFEEAFAWKKPQYFGIMIQPENDGVVSWKIDVIDLEGYTAFRYYVPLEAERSNFLLFDWRGFRNTENLKSDFISKMEINIYAKRENLDSSLKVNFGDVLLFENKWALKSFFGTDTSFYFPENLKKGNLY